MNCAVGQRKSGNICRKFVNLSFGSLKTLFSLPPKKTNKLLISDGKTKQKFKNLLKYPMAVNDGGKGEGNRPDAGHQIRDG